VSNVLYLTEKYFCYESLCVCIIQLTSAVGIKRVVSTEPQPAINEKAFLMQMTPTRRTGLHSRHITTS